MDLFKPKNGSPLLENTFAHFLPFHLEEYKYNIVEELTPGCIVPVLLKWMDEDVQVQIDYLKSLNFADQTILLLSVFHVAEFQTNQAEEVVKQFWRKLTENIILVNTNLRTENVFYDFLWNRQKAYYLDNQSYVLLDRTWSKFYEPQQFELPSFQKNQDTKKALVPVRVREEEHPRMKFRKRLIDSLMPIEEQCFLSKPNQLLLSHACTFASEGAAYHPISNHYYESSYVSIYTETLVSGEVRSVTEKTYDPLIKGHFILPFGYCGLVSDIKSYGFLLPDWIDYSYDSEADDRVRFNKFLESVFKLMRKTLDELHQHYLTDVDKLKFNRSLFINKDYDSLYEKLCQKIQKKH